MFCTTFIRFLVKSFHEAGEISSIAQRSIPRLTSGIDHLAVDVTSLASSAGRFTRDMMGHERDEEAVKIVMKAIQTNVLRRLKVKKSIAFLMDGTDPLWKVHHLRQFPGKVFDKAFYRSAASPMVYLLEEHILKLVGELRGTMPVLECVVSGPSTPGPAAMKMTAWLLDLYSRALPASVTASAAWSLLKRAGEMEDGGEKVDETATSEKVTGAAPVAVEDSIILIGNAEDIHLNAWGATPWTPTSLASPASFCTVSFDQRDAYALTLSDSLEWLEMGDVYQAAITSASASKGSKDAMAKDGEPTSTANETVLTTSLAGTTSPARHALSAARTDAVFLYLLAFGSPAFGLPPLFGSVSFAQWMSAYTQERARQRQQLEKALAQGKGGEEKGTTGPPASRSTVRGGKASTPPPSLPPPVLFPSTLGTLIHAYASERHARILEEGKDSHRRSATRASTSTSSEQGGNGSLPAGSAALLTKKDASSVATRKDEGVDRSTVSPLRLHVDALRRVLLAASQRPATTAGKYHPAVEHYLEVSLQTLHAYTCGFLPHPLYAPSDAKANFGEKGMRGVSVEHVVSHLQYLIDRAPLYTASHMENAVPASSPVTAASSASTRGSMASASSAATSSPLSCHRVSVAPVSPSSLSPSASSSPAALPCVELYSRCASLSAGEVPIALTGAQQLCLSTTKPEYMKQVLPIMARGHVPTAEQISSIIEAKTAADALPHVQELLPPHNEAFLQPDAESSAENEKKDEKKAEEQCSWIDGALCYHPTHYVCRSGVGAIAPWQYYSVDLGVKSEALNVRSLAS